MNKLLIILSILFGLNSISTNVSAEVNIDLLKQKYQKCDDNLYRHDCFDNLTYSNTKRVGYFKNNSLWDGLEYQGNTLIFEYKNGKRIIKSYCSESNGGWYNCPSGNRYKPLDTGYLDKNGQQGIFKYEFKSGSTHVGEYKDGKRHGQGTYYYFSGEKYIGGWKNNKKHGYGTYIYPNGNKYVGQYKYGVRNGQGTFTWADGKVEEGMWNNGEFMYANKPTTTSFGGNFEFRSGTNP